MSSSHPNGHRDAAELSDELRPGGPGSCGGASRQGGARRTGRPARSPRTPTGKLLQAARAELGLTTAETCRRLAITPNAWYAWTSGQALPGARRLARLVLVLELDAQQLLEALAASPQSGLRAKDRS